MHTSRVLMAVAVIAMLPLAGCIENMSDLRDRLQGSSTSVPDTNTTLPDDAEDVTNMTMNETRELKPPVARITVFGPNGALVYRASFVAENVTTPIPSDAGEISLVAADSEAVEAGTDIVKFEWTVGTETYEGRKVAVDLSEPQVAHIVLRVTDSKNSTDEQMIMIGILPVPFTETFTMTGGPVGGVAGTPLLMEAENAFKVLAEKDGKKLKAQKLVVSISQERTADYILRLKNPAGEETSADAAIGSYEVMTVENPASGDWVATVSMYAGVAPSYTLSFEITYIQVVEGLDDGHAHQH